MNVNPHTLKVLLVEDDVSTARIAGMTLRNAAERANVSILITTVDTMEKARALAHGMDCVLLDLGLPDSPVEQTVTALPELCAQWPVTIVVSNFVYPEDHERDSERTAQERGLYWRVLKLGACNVFQKAMMIENPAVVLDAVRKAVYLRIVANRQREQQAA